MKKRLKILLCLMVIMIIIIPFSNESEAIPVHSKGHDITFDNVLDQSDFTGATSGGSLASGNYYLTEDMSFDKFAVSSGETVNLCLNGHTLTLGGSTAQEKIVGTLNIYDCSSDNTGTILFKDYYYGFLVEGTLNIDGATLKQNFEGTFTTIWLGSNANLSINNGKVISNDIGIDAANSVNITITDSLVTAVSYALRQYKSYQDNGVGSISLSGSTFTGAVYFMCGNNSLKDVVINHETGSGIGVSVDMSLGAAPTISFDSVKVSEMYIQSGVTLNIKGNNNIGEISYMYLEESGWKNDNLKVGEVYIYEPHPINVVGQLTNTNKIGISVSKFDESDFKGDKVKVISNFDTYHSGENFSNYFKAVYDVNAIFLTSESGDIYANRFKFTHNATDSEQYVTVNALNSTFQWYKVAEDATMLDGSMITENYGGTYDSTSKTFKSEESGELYALCQMLEPSSTFNRVKVWVPKNSVLKTVEYSWQGGPKDLTGGEYMLYALEPFSVTAKVKYNGGSWENLTNINTYSSTIGTYSNGVWSAEYYEDLGYYLLNIVSLYTQENSGTLQYEVTVKDDVCVDDRKITTDYIDLFFIFTLNASYKVKGYNYIYDKDNGNNTYENNPTENGIYVCRVDIGDSYVDSDMVTVDTFKEKTDNTKKKTVSEDVKIDPTYTVPETINVYEGAKLSDIELPEGFSFQDDLDTLVGNEGEYQFLLTYTPSDIDKYNIVKDIPVTIKVSKEEPVPTPEPEKKSHGWIYGVGGALILFFIIILIKRKKDKDEENK